MEDIEGFEGYATVAFPHLGPELPEDREEGIELGGGLVGYGEEGLQVLEFYLPVVWSSGLDDLAFQFGGKCCFELAEEGTAPSAEAEGEGEGGGGRGWGEYGAALFPKWFSSFSCFSSSSCRLGWWWWWWW